MAGQKAMVQTMPVSAVRQRFGELVNQVYHRRLRVVVEKSGIPVAALVSLADLEHCLDQEESATRGEEVKTTARQSDVLQPPSEEELVRRQALVARILTHAETRVITPVTSADLVHQVRQAERKAYGRW